MYVLLLLAVLLGTSKNIFTKMRSENLPSSKPILFFMKTERWNIMFTGEQHPIQNAPIIPSPINMR